jgi:hypothetical protein
MTKFFFVVTILSSCGAALLLAFAFMSDGSAPQQAAMAAMAAAMAVIPYVFTRSFQLMEDNEASRVHWGELKNAVRDLKAQPVPTSTGAPRPAPMPAPDASGSRYPD